MRCAWMQWHWEREDGLHRKPTIKVGCARQFFICLPCFLLFPPFFFLLPPSLPAFLLSSLPLFVSFFPLSFLLFFFSFPPPSLTLCISLHFGRWRTMIELLPLTSFRASERMAISASCWDVLCSSSANIWGSRSFCLGKKGDDKERKWLCIWPRVLGKYLLSFWERWVCSLCLGHSRARMAGFQGGVRAEAGRAVLLSTFLFKKWAYVTGYGNIFLWLFLSWKLSVIN